MQEIGIDRQGPERQPVRSRLAQVVPRIQAAHRVSDGPAARK